MIDDSPQCSTGKRCFNPIDLSYTGSKRGKVLPHYPSASNYHIKNTNKYQDAVPTAADYANLVFCSSDDESDAVIDEPCIKKRRKDRRKRRVSFGAFIPIIHHLHDTPLASDMTPEEKTELWLNAKDLEEMKVSANNTIQDMRGLVIESQHADKRTTFRALMAKLEQDKNTSVRGLEHRVFRRKVSRQVLVDEVLECQQHIQGLAKFGHTIINYDKITLLANVSSKRSSSAASIALLNAKHDAIEICTANESRTNNDL